MIAERERALTLAHEAEAKGGLTPPSIVVERATVYLNFPLGESNAGASAVPQGFEADHESG
jgi:hypothetical protein